MQAETQKLYQDASRSVDDRVADLLSRMSLEEKIGQMAQAEKNSIKPEEVRQYYIGSVLSGGGGYPSPNTPKNWREMVHSFAEAALQTPLAIPLIYGSDAVHGHNNVQGAVIFPHNIGLGATRNPALVEKIAQATARECLATGVHWNFAPAVSVPQDIRWGRTYEGFSEDTAVVTELGLAYLRGLHNPQLDGTRMLGSVKHFAADGGTAWNSRADMPYFSVNNWQAASPNWRIDQGDARIDEDELRRVHLAPYKAAVDAGCLNIMVSFSSWNGTKMHANQYLLTDVLKGEFGFEGFLVSDWMAINQISENYNVAVRTAINAGLDMIMVPYDFKAFIETLTNAVRNGSVSQERIDDAVRRIMRVKFLLGLFENPLTDAAWLEQVGIEEHRAIARDAVQQSLVLLKHENKALPLNSDTKLLVGGVAADDIGLACGGWTIDWQGAAGRITEGTTLLEGLQRTLGEEIVVYEADVAGDERYPVGLIAVAEEPYAEGEGDRPDLTLSDELTAQVKAMCARCDKVILVIYSGRPIVIQDLVNDVDAVVAAWLPGSEAGAIADVLTGDVPFTGKLSYTWIANMDQLPLATIKANGYTPQWAFGHGLSL